MTEFRCPACGFRVFSRGYPLCEGCARPLPQDLLFSAQEREIRDRPAVESTFTHVPGTLGTPPRRDGLLGAFDTLIAPMPVPKSDWLRYVDGWPAWW